MKKIFIFLLLTALIAPSIKAAPLYDYQFITQAPYTVMTPGETQTLWIEVKNTGATSWTSDVVHLGTSAPMDRVSQFQTSSWLTKNRVTPFDPKYTVGGKLPTGYHSRFTFTVTAPSTPGVYREYFRPVAEGIGWMKDIGIYWEITVSGSAQDPQPNTQTLLNKFAPSVVRIICNSDGWSGDVYKGTGNMSQGSGTLLDSNSGFVIVTNLHVVKTNDDSLSKCNIALTKTPSDISSMVFFRSQTYRYNSEDLDFATIKPEVITEPGYRAGTLDDLKNYSVPKNTTICPKAEFMDNVFALGYPQGSGNLVTITSGKVIGFGYLEWDNSRYIKTDAFTDHGSSGGLAIKDTGCIFGTTSAGNGSFSYVFDWNVLF